MRRRAIRRYVEALLNGEPVALAFTALVALGLVFALVCWLLDQRNKRKAEEKKRRKDKPLRR